ncbi:MAG: hypothetical protein FD175_1336 [Beijerinckiaceae bacterium]|nr:MAG: hypothetical protein FD175_1336 [Beijerinckiaceae bacterium]
MPPSAARRGIWFVLAPVLGLALIIVPLFLVGAPNVDAEQARLCRMVLPALYPEDDGIEILSSEPGQRSAVHVAFRTSAGGREHLLTCRFGGIGYSAAKRDLVAILVDGVGLGEAAFYFAKERWLESRHAVLADPGAPGQGRGWITLPRGAAVVLQHAINGLPRTGILALLALATALIYGLIGRINLAFGEFAALGGIAASMGVVIAVLAGITTPLLAATLALIAALALSALYGFAMGRAILWPLATTAAPGRSSASGQPLLVAGVGMLVAIQEGLRLAQGAGTLWLPPASGEAWRIASAPGFDVVAHPRLLAMVAINWLAIGLTLAVMHRTALGRAWRASADDPFAASLCGIDPRRLLITISALSTMLAGLAGATITLNYGGMHFSGGTLIGLTGLIAAILGGIGSLGGAVLGGVVIAGFQVGWSALRDIAQWELATFTLLTLALILKPGGFFGFADGAQRKA